MNKNNFKVIYRTFVGATACYTTYRMLQKKSEDLLKEGGMLDAFAVGAGHAGLALTAGYIAATTLTKKW